mmetsp:Transcript_34102/g.104766  ORF Transcript_34102/g.104766 Transcript_34102/m.104766 type:complete len:202 (+) Transcript_34102:382-987(+)
MLRQDRSHVLPRDISVKGHSSIVQAPQKHCTGFGLTRRTYLQPATHMAPDGHCTGQSDAIRPDSEAENANHKRCTPPAWLNLNTLWKILQSRYTALSRNATVGAHRRQGRNRTPPLGVARAQRMPPPTGQEHDVLPRSRAADAAVLLHLLVGRRTTRHTRHPRASGVRVVVVSNARGSHGSDTVVHAARHVHAATRHFAPH